MRRSIRPAPVPAPLRPGALLSHFRGGRLMFNEVNGELWVTDSYMAARLGEKSPLIDWLALYNLSPEPMCCTVGATVLRNDNPPPAIETLANVKGLAKFPTATRFLIGSAPVLVEGEGPSSQLEVWEATQQFCLNPRIRRVAEALAGPGEWVKDPVPDRPAYRIADGKPTGIVMPVRNLSIIADERAA